MEIFSATFDQKYDLFSLDDRIVEWNYREIQDELCNLYPNTTFQAIITITGKNGKNEVSSCKLTGTLSFKSCHSKGKKS